MSKIFIEESFKTPEIKGDAQLGQLSLKGRSLPEDAKTFYQPFKKWLQELYSSPSDSIDVVIELEYYNTASSKLIVNMLLSLEKLQSSKKVSVLWLYDEDDIEMEETGQDFKNLIGEMIVIKSKTND